MAICGPEKSLFVFDFIGPPGVHFGWDEHREGFKQMFGPIGGPLRLAMSDLDVEVSGILAMAAACSVFPESALKMADRAGACIAPDFTSNVRG